VINEVAPIDLPDDGTLPGWNDLPQALRKACVDHFNYLVVLRSGRMIRFEAAVYYSGDWIRLLSPAGDLPGGLPYARGIDVRLSEIICAADAPL
jgi:hypothetical protein